MSDPTPVGDARAIDWQMTTFAGARREQLRRWSRLSLRQVILALEEMEELGKRLGSGPATRKG
jgi:hypothetical protein